MKTTENVYDGIAQVLIYQLFKHGGNWKAVNCSTQLSIR